MKESHNTTTGFVKKMSKKFFKKFQILHQSNLFRLQTCNLQYLVIAKAPYVSNFVEIRIYKIPGTTKCEFASCRGADRQLAFCFSLDANVFTMSVLSVWY